MLIGVSSLSSFANDTLKYRSAYEYLESKNDSIKAVFEYIIDDTSSLCFVVSNQIIPYNYSLFSDEIVNYEFSDSNSTFNEQILDSLKYKTKRIDYSDIRYIFWKDNYFQNKKTCELILFFGKIEGNKMIAEILVRHRNTDDYKIINGYGTVDMTFLFYFEGDSVKKVFTKVLLL